MTGGRGEQVSNGIGHLGEVRKGAFGTGLMGEVKERDLSGSGGR